MNKVVVLFNIPGGTALQYEQVWEDLKAAGHEHPKGLISHVGAAKPDGNWLVVDIWESEEAFAEFGKTLMPLIVKSGLPVAAPLIIPAHYVYIGQTEDAHV